MPIIKSAKKRVRVAAKAAIRNSKTKRSLKDAVKSFARAIAGGKKVTEAHAKAQSELDKALKKGVMHKNKVARKKRQLARATKAAGAKPAAAKPAPKKALAKKPTAAKKAPAKK